MLARAALVALDIFISNELDLGLGLVVVVRGEAAVTAGKRAVETREGGLEEVDEEREEQRSDEVLEVCAWAASYSFWSRSSALMASRSYSLISSSMSACAFAAAAAAVAAAVLGWR